MRMVEPGSAEPCTVGVAFGLGDAGSVAVSEGALGAVESGVPGDPGVGGVGTGPAAPGRTTLMRRAAARQLLRSLRSRTRRSPSAHASTK